MNKYFSLLFIGLLAFSCGGGLGGGKGTGAAGQNGTNTSVGTNPNTTNTTNTNPNTNPSTNPNTNPQPDVYTWTEVPLPVDTGGPLKPDDVEGFYNSRQGQDVYIKMKDGELFHRLATDANFTLIDKDAEAAPKSGATKVKLDGINKEIEPIHAGLVLSDKAHKLAIIRGNQFVWAIDTSIHHDAAAGEDQMVAGLKENVRISPLAIFDIGGSEQVVISSANLISGGFYHGTAPSNDDGQYPVSSHSSRIQPIDSLSIDYNDQSVFNFDMRNQRIKFTNGTTETITNGFYTFGNSYTIDGKEYIHIKDRGIYLRKKN